VEAVIAAESGFNPAAVSADGAVGLMQLLPATATDYGGPDLCDPIANLEAGAAHLARLLRQYRNISHALAAYNAGEGTMQTQRRRVTISRRASSSSGRSNTIGASRSERRIIGPGEAGSSPAIAPSRHTAPALNPRRGSRAPGPS